jgi:hypothetical protein
MFFRNDEAQVIRILDEVQPPFIRTEIAVIVFRRTLPVTRMVVSDDQNTAAAHVPGKCLVAEKVLAHPVQNLQDCHRLSR